MLSGCLKLLLMISTLFSLTAQAQTCRVVGVADGDTLTALCAGNVQMKIRIAEIDAPEKKQPFGLHSKQALSDLCFGQQATITPQTRDRYGRTVARVSCQGKDVSTEQIRAGMAWVYDQYVTDRSLYAEQEKARAGRAGMWGFEGNVPPWEYRHKRG